MFQNYVRVQPPHIKWETRSIEKRKLIEEGGSRYYVDIDYAVVTPIGSRDSVEKEVLPWLMQLEFECSQMPPRFDREWLEAIRKSYDRWKKGQEIPVDGTPIVNWPVASPAEVKMLQKAGVRTVEDLVNLNHEGLQAIGMGGISLQNRAKEWVSGKTSIGPLVEKVDALAMQLAVLMEANAQQAATIKLQQTEIDARDKMLASRAMSPAERFEPHQRANEYNSIVPSEESIADEVGRSLG